MKLPRDIGPVHFIGIGGIGMSGIAEVLVNLGYQVQGSDQAEGANVKRLRDKGMAVAIGHAAENVTGARVVVVSSAIKRDNPELVAARAARLPVVRRAEMLAELMRLKSCIAIAGTHGKTTTTSMVAALLDAGGFDPTVINGGIINAYGTNAHLGAGDWMVVEADESDGTFLRLPADIAVVTNVDPEHLDHFRTFEAVQEAFRAFIENVPFYGFSVMCTDHPVVQSSSAASKITALLPTARIRRPMCASSRSRTPAGFHCSQLCSATAPGNRCTKSGMSRCRCRAGTTRSTPPPPSPWPMSWASPTP